MRSVSLAFALICCSAPAAASAHTWDLSLAGETRWFPTSSSTEEVHISPSALLETNTPITSDLRLSTSWFARLDSRDQTRTHVDVREIWLDAKADDWEYGFGITQEFWGVVESHHLINVLNQRDGVEDIDGEDFLGQPMLKIARHWPSMELAAYVMPFFREREFHEYGERFAFPLEIAEATYESGAEEFHVDTALRWSTYTDTLDVGISYFWGTDREPVLNLTQNTMLNPVLEPYYAQIQQASIDAQVTKGPWLFKLEALHRRGESGDFGAWVYGFEYTFFQAFGNTADIGVVVERLEDKRPRRGLPVQVFDDDLFLATRIALNNTSDTNLLVGAYLDRDTSERIFRLEISHRLSDQFSLAVTASAFDSKRATQPLFFIRDDDFLSVTITANLGSR